MTMHELTDQLREAGWLVGLWEKYGKSRVYINGFVLDGEKLRSVSKVWLDGDPSDPDLHVKSSTYAPKFSIEVETKCVGKGLEQIGLRHNRRF